MASKGYTGTVTIVIILILLPAIIPLPSLANEEKGWTRTCTVHIAAVSSTGGGVLSNLTVTLAYPGKGRVYISTSPASEIDTQGSARLAALAASIVAGVDMSSYDFYYDIEAPSIIVGGPSAGAEMALATLFLLLGEKCNTSIVATGMIQPDTTIGPVGGLKEKLEAVARAGGKMFVVPEGQLVYTYYQEKTIRRGPFIFVTREPVTVNLTEIGKQLGVKVMEASSLLDLYYIARYGTHAPVQHPNIPQPREDIVDSVESIINSLLSEANSTINALTSKGTRNDLVRIAGQYSETAGNLLNSGDIYGSLLNASLAYGMAIAADKTEEALQNDLDVTDLVTQANLTLDLLWDRLENASTSNTFNLTSLALSSWLVGEASYYYALALQNLVERDGSYYLPESLLTVDLTGSWLLGKTLGYAKAAEYIMELSTKSTGEEVSLEKLERFSRTLEATAKSSLAYAEKLFQEVGASTDTLNEPAYLLDLASTSNSSIVKAGLSIGAISIVSTSIHKTFNTWSTSKALGIIEVFRSLKLNDTIATLLLYNSAYPQRLDASLLIAVLGSRASGKNLTTPSLPISTPTGTNTTVPEMPGNISLPITAPQPAETPGRPSPAPKPGNNIGIIVMIASAAIVIIVALALVLQSAK